MQRISFRQTTGGETTQLVLDRAADQSSLRIAVNDRTTSRSLAADQLKQLDQAVAAARIPVSPGRAADPSAGGVSLTLHLDGNESHFHWAGTPPDGWEPLAAIADALLALRNQETE